MKKGLRILMTLLVVLLAVCVGAALAMSCEEKDDDDGTGTNTITGSGSGTPPGSGTGPLGNGVNDWTIAAAPEGVTSTNSKGTEDGALMFKWAGPSEYYLTECWGKLPLSFAVEDYDGLTFDIKIDTTNNYAIMIRAQGEGKAWRLKDQYIESNTEWQSWEFPFDDALPQYGEYAESTLKEWLNGSGKSAQKLVYINPVINPGNPVDTSKYNKQFTTYLKNIGFTKDTSDDVAIIW